MNIQDPETRIFKQEHGDRDSPTLTLIPSRGTEGTGIWTDRPMDRSSDEIYRQGPPQIYDKKTLGIQWVTLRR